MEREEALAIIYQVQQQYPDLTASGFSNERHARGHSLDPKAVGLCIEWLLRHDAFERRKTINTRRTSYSWKHIVERHFDTYIANGDFICAALYLKYKMKKRRLNAYFNIKELKNALR